MLEIHVVLRVGINIHPFRNNTCAGEQHNGCFVVVYEGLVLGAYLPVRFS